MKLIDLRSDTVTRPTPEMRKAMAEAEVGDDVYGEDPTVNSLEQLTAEITGKEAALFVPTGTMGNVIALKLHTEHGQEIVCDERAHILDWELSMVAWFAGCLLRPVSGGGALPRWEHYRAGLRAFGPHNAPTTCLEIENTHNMLGGRVYPLGDLDEIYAEAHARQIKVHLDGARVFNAAVALDVPVSRIAGGADTVMFSLSKGLGAPVGSMLCGAESDIARGRRYRKRLGGGMRQAGVLAAAGIVALQNTPPKLKIDHANARRFAKGIVGLAGVAIDLETIQSNIVIFDVAGTGKTPAAISACLRERGILLNGINDRQMRAVTHYDVSEADCLQAAGALAEILEA